MAACTRFVIVLGAVPIFLAASRSVSCWKNRRSIASRWAGGSRPRQSLRMACSSAVSNWLMVAGVRELVPRQTMSFSSDSEKA